MQNSSYAAYIPQVDAARATPPVQRRTIRKGVRRAAGAAAVMLLLLGFALLGWRTHRHHQLLAGLAQERSPRRLFAAVQGGQITRDEAISIIRQSPRAQERTRRIQNYFALSPGSARRQYLDRLIDELAARRAQRRAANGAAIAPIGRPDAGMTSNPGDRPGGAARFESIPPQQRAEFQQFRYDMNQRMQQRGVALGR